MAGIKKIVLYRRSYAGKIILALFAISIVVIVSLLLFIQTGTFESWVKGKINEWIVENIDGKVDIGTLGFELLPPRIFAETVSVADKKGTKFLTCEKIEIIPDPISLIKENINFEEIAFTKPSINLIIDNNRIINLPSLKKPLITKGKKPILETLSIIDGDVNLIATSSAPWPVEAHLSSISLDVTGEENIIFEVRLLTGKGTLKAGDVEAAIEKIETRTTVELTDEFQKLKIKYLNLNAGEIGIALQDSELALNRQKGPSILTNFVISSPLPIASKLSDRVPALKGYEKCEGTFSYCSDKINLDASCEIEDLWIKQFEVGSLSARIIYNNDILVLEKATLHGGGGILAFDAAVDLTGNKEITFEGHMNGLEISKIFEQLGDRRCGAKFNGSGPLKLAGTLDPLNLKGNIDTDVKGFRIFTRHHKHPGAREVLNIPKGHVKSNIEITGKFFRFRGANVKVQSTAVTADVKLNFDQTMDITANAHKFNGADIKTIAKVPLKGTGKLRCSIKGRMKSPTIKSSGNLSNFSFAEVNFGNVDFKLEYRGQSTLLLPEVKAKKGKSKYEISDGQIVFRTRKKGGLLIEGNIYAEKIYVSDFQKIFNVKSRLLEEIEARSHGELFIKYEPDIKQTTVNADLSLSDITVFGESFEKGSLKGEWNTEDINVQALNMQGKLGEVSIVGSKGENDSMNFEVKLKNIKSKYLKLVDFSSYGLSFALGTTTQVKGTLDMPFVDNAVVHVRNVKLGGVPQDDGTILLNFRNNMLTLTGDLINSEILWKSITDFKKDGATEFVVDINNLELDHKELSKITGKLTGEKHTLGITGNIKGSGVLFDNLKFKGSADFSKLTMKISGYDIRNDRSVKIGFTQKSLSFKQVQLKGEGTKIRLTGGLNKKGPAVSLQGNIDLNLLKKFTSEITAAEGYVSPRLLLSGKWEKTYFLGETGIHCKTLRLKTASVRFSEVTGNMSLDHNTVAVNLGGNVSGGEFLASGTMQMESLKPVSYEIYSEFNDVNIRLLKGVPIGLEGTLTLARNTKTEDLPRISGDVWVTSLRYTKDFILSQQVEAIVAKTHAKDVQVYDKRKQNFALDIAIHGSKNLSVKNNLANAGFRIDESQKPFKVIGTDILPVMFGTIIVNKGSVQWKGRTFDLDRGRIEFNDPVKTKVHFDVLANGEIKDWRIQLHAIGTPDDFIVHLTSLPELPEEDIILLIQFGMTREEMAKMENAEAVAAEITSQAIGLDTHVKQLIPIIDQFGITSEFSKQTNKVEPRVTMGKKLTDQIRLSAVSGITSTESLEKGTYFKAVVEYKVTDALSIQAAYDNQKSPEVGKDGQQFGNVGVDIKWRIEF